MAAKSAVKCGMGGSPALGRLAQDVWDFSMREAPSWATFIGDRRFEDRLEERGPGARDRRKSGAKEMLARLRKIPARGLGEENAITRAVLERVLSEMIESYDHRAWEWEFNQLSGLHVELQDLLAFHPKDDVKGVEHLLARCEAIPAAFRPLKGDLRDGLRSGRA